MFVCRYWGGYVFIWVHAKGFEALYSLVCEFITVYGYYNGGVRVFHKGMIGDIAKYYSFACTYIGDKEYKLIIFFPSLPEGIDGSFLIVSKVKHKEYERG